MNTELFGKLPPTRLFFRCAVPAVITSVFGALYSVVDGIFVGRYLGEDALAAINFIRAVPGQSGPDRVSGAQFPQSFWEIALRVFFCF